MRIKSTPVAALTTLMASMLLAQSASALAQSQWLPYNPRLQVSGTLSQEGIFDADGLVPLYGNWDGFVYGALNARYSTDDTGLLAPGLGMRYVAHNNLYGAYVFADAARTNPKANFWVLNPGIEWASPRWDAHVNGYIPTKRSKALGKADFYSNYGDYSQVSFKGHSQYDALGVLSVAVGQGLDAEVGYSLPLSQYRSRVFVGGYYFNMPQQLKAVQGVAGGIQVPLNAYADLLLTDSYDKLRRHEVALSVRLTLGSKNSYSDDVHDRMLERVERHVGMWTTGNGTISQQALQATNQRALYKDNIWFFKPGGNTAAEPVSLQACTFEHPCSQFDQQTIDSINQVSANANFYLTPGTYTIAPTDNQAAEIFQLNQGQSIYGRNGTYHAPATGDARALLAGPVKAMGDNTLANVRVVNNGITTHVSAQGQEGPVVLGLYLPKNNTGTVTLQGVDVKAMSKVDVNVIGVLVQGGHLVMQGGSLQAENTSDGSVLGALGMLGDADSLITTHDVVITAKSSSEGTIGIASSGSSKIILNGGSVLAEGTGDVDTGMASLGNDSHITANDVTIRVKNSGDSAIGIASANKGQVTLNGGSILAESINGIASGLATSDDTALITAKNIVVEVNGGSGTIGLLSQGTINAENIQLKVSGPSDKTKLTEGQPGNIHFSGNNLCKVNGQIVTCS